jgi:hypothetical protein
MDNQVHVSEVEQASFFCAVEEKLGGVLLAKGDIISAVGDGFGFYRVYVNWGEGCIAKIRKDQVNQLAGMEVL